MNMRIVADRNAPNVRLVYCMHCSVLDKRANARSIRAHVQSTGHRVSVSETAHVVYRRELTQ